TRPVPPSNQFLIPKHQPDPNPSLNLVDIVHNRLVSGRGASSSMDNAVEEWIIGK
ncbi:hypothetical protein AVEN_34520-1, partial [Araneus ventricosus]